jgi:hypothetical protein
LKSPIRPKLAQAENFGRQLIYSYVEHGGPKKDNHLDPDKFPTKALQDVAEAVFYAMLEDGCTDFSGVRTALNDAPPHILAEFGECCDGFAPLPQDCGGIIEKLTEYYFELQHDILTQRLAKEIADGQPTTETIRQLGELEAGDYRSSPQFQAFYDGVKFYLDNGKDFIPMDGRSIKAQIDHRKIPNSAAMVCEIQTNNFVKYNGPLAGRMRGVYEFNGDKLLASISPKIIRSKAGEFPTIGNLIRALFDGDEYKDTQISSFYGWMKTARHAMLKGKRRPGQALVLAGPIACGKSQLIKQIIVPAMGGRSARPYKFFSGKTGFNADLLGAEVLIIDDEVATTRIEGRRTLGESIKCNLFATSVRIEGKFRTGFDFEPLWRLVIAVNDKPENLLVLPPLDGDIHDKLMILKCQKAVELSDDDFENWEKEIRDQMPAFLHFVENYEIPVDQREGRCGVRHFHHPEIVSAISELSPEHQLRTLIDGLESSGGITIPWEGTASGLKALFGNSAVKNDADRLLGSWPAACGVYLGRLESKGVSKLPMKDGDQRWRIE